MTESPTPRQEVKQLGATVARYRVLRQWSQQQLAQAVGVNRTAISKLEQGLRLLPPEALSQLGDVLAIADTDWQHSLGALESESKMARDFQGQLSELLGKPVTFESLDPISQKMAIESIAHFFQTTLTPQQAHAHFNSILTFYGEKPVSVSFFERFFGHGNLTSVAEFERCVRHFQRVAIRIYGSFRKAFKTLSVASNLNTELEPLQPVSVAAFKLRRPFVSIQLIERERLDDLGYISAERVERQHKERQELATKLRTLAAWVRANPQKGLQNYPAKTLTRIQTLLRKFHSHLEIEDTLFTTVNPLAIEQEAQHISPQDTALARIKETQETGLRNLAAYLTEPYMDVYIATSMRERADFVSVNVFVETLFHDSILQDLHLRYFNPTLSWVEDRIAKGLVEALMLKRAKMAVYMAQKGDTFGKDSEASVSLGQGKPVIVYVPRLYDAATGINSEALMGLTETELRQHTDIVGLDDESTDRHNLVSRILHQQLSRLSGTDLQRVIENHWADFDLYGELKEMDVLERDAVQAYLDQLTLNPESQIIPNLTGKTLDALLERLIHVALFFERRARTFRDVHPLALQVILSSGVLNGILVVRSAATCAQMVYELLTNTIQTELIVDKDNYKLIEKHTQSTLRVISKHKLLTHAFWTQYFAD